MTEWQDISTAPLYQDDCSFLIFVPSAIKRKISLSRGGTYPQEWFKAKGYTIINDHGNSVRATHWMPLPTPPVQP